MPGVTSEKAKPKSFMSAETSDRTKLLGFMFAEGSAIYQSLKKESVLKRINIRRFGSSSCWIAIRFGSTGRYGWSIERCPD